MTLEMQVEKCVASYCQSIGYTSCSKSTYASRLQATTLTSYRPNTYFPASTTPIRSAPMTPPALAAATVWAARWLSCAR